jgi:Ca2+-binding EF-hand superfamily protein
VRSLLPSLALGLLLSVGCGPPPPLENPPPASAGAPAPVHHFDKDGDGHVSAEEYKAAVARKFDDLDKDKSGTIHVEKECSPLFIAWCRKADRDRDGHISRQEFQDHAEEQFRNGDSNGDARLNREELGTALGSRSPWH